MHGKIQFDHLEIDFENFHLSRDGEDVHLTKTEWTLLRELLAHNHQVVTYQLLLQRVWGMEYYDESSYVHTYMSRLRKKIEEDPGDPRYIMTESGIGYRIDFPLSNVPSDEAESRTNPANEAETTEANTKQPPVKTVNPLPQDVAAHYIGRETEQAELIDLLLKGTRLISVYGRGGVGKTALVCKVLSDLQHGEYETFFDGMVFLSATSTGLNLSRIFNDFKKLLPHVDTTVLDTPHTGQKTLIQKITAFLDMLSGGNYILLLDNLEDLQRPGTHDLTDEEIETFMQVALTQGSTLRIVVTSRYPVSLPRLAKVWEHIIPLDEGLPKAESVLMLRNSAPASLTEIHEASENDLALIAEKTRGFPRALQSVIGLLLEDQILTLDDLIHDESLFSDEIETVFVENAIQRLNEEAILVMQGLALFDSLVDQDGLARLLQAHLPTGDIRAILNRLVQAYFVVYNRATRLFSLHPIDQAYCYSQIPQGTRQDKSTDQFTCYALHHRAAEYYSEQMKSLSDPQTYEEIQPSLSELRHRIKAEEYNTAAQVLFEIDEQLHRWGYYTLLNDFYTELIDHIDEKQINPTLLRLGEVKRTVGQVNEAIELYQRVLKNSQDDQQLAMAHHNLGWANYDLGQFEEAISHWHAANDFFSRYDYTKGMADVQGGIGWVSYLNGNYAEADKYFRQALNLYRVIGDSYGEGVNLGDLGAVFSATGSYGTAIDHLNTALSIAEDLGAQRELNHKGGYLATALLMTDDLDKALEAATTALKFDVPTNQYTVAAIHGVILACLGRTDEAKQAFSDAIKYADILLQYSTGLYQARYARALALTGLSLLNAQPFDEAIKDYHLATTLCSTTGVIDANVKLLDALAKYQPHESIQQIQQILLSEKQD